MTEGTVFEGALVPSISIENLLNQRDGIRSRISKAIEVLTEAQELGEASGINTAQSYRGFDYILAGGGQYRGTNLLAEKAIDEITKRLDANAWNHLLSESGIRTLMDQKARAEWMNKIDKADVPELTAENIKATFGNLYASRQDIFERGVVNAFRELSWCYKTNRPFAFGKRIVIRYLRNQVIDSGGNLLGYPNLNNCNKLDDLIRVFSVMDGKPEPDHRQGIYHLLYDGDARKARDVETTYLSIRSFRNGNGHITFKRPDLVTKMNQILARHYPAMLPADRAEGAQGFEPVKVA